MAKILAIETSGSSCSVALAISGDIHQLTDDTPRSHARKLLPMVDELFGQAGVKPNELQGIAFTKGPGSFTGLRIGFGAVQGLAMGLGLPVWGVSTLRVMAEKAVHAYPVKSGLLVASLDARMGEVYWSAYEIEGSRLAACIFADSARSPADVCRMVTLPPMVSVGSGQPLLAAEGLVAEKINLSDFEADAGVVASLAVSAFEREEFVPVDEASLSYIRNEVSWKKHQKIRPKVTSGEG